MISNCDGSLCAHYPLDIIIPVAESEGHAAEIQNNSSLNQDYEELSLAANDEDLLNLFSESRFARTRSRFVCPVINVHGKVGTNFLESFSTLNK